VKGAEHKSAPCVNSALASSDKPGLGSQAYSQDGATLPGDAACTGKATTMDRSSLRVGVKVSLPLDPRKNQEKNQCATAAVACASPSDWRRRTPKPTASAGPCPTCGRRPRRSGGRRKVTEQWLRDAIHTFEGNVAEMAAAHGGISRQGVAQALARYGLTAAQRAARNETVAQARAATSQRKSDQRVVAERERCLRVRAECRVRPDGAFDIVLPDGESTVVDAHLVDELKLHRWYRTASGYAGTKLRKEHGKLLFLHRFVMREELAEAESAGLKMQTDHINGDRLDNRKANLRLATAAQNTQNTKRGPLVGVRKEGGKWAASIQANRQKTRLGTFDTPAEAAQAYRAAAEKLHGEFRARVAPLPPFWEYQNEPVAVDLAPVDVVGAVANDGSPVPESRS